MAGKPRPYPSSLSGSAETHNCSTPWHLARTTQHRTHTQSSSKARSPTACIHITTRSQTNHSQMDVLPAYLNRDSFQGSFKGLVALEIIIDLPIGFPINNIISLYVVSKHHENFSENHSQAWVNKWSTPTHHSTTIRCM